jgi:hypothetical protein
MSSGTPRKAGAKGALSSKATLLPNCLDCHTGRRELLTTDISEKISIFICLPLFTGSSKINATLRA